MIVYGPEHEFHQNAMKRFGWVFKYAPDAWIAGGALRAFFARESVKDIDLFHRERDSLDGIGWQDVAEQFAMKGWQQVVANPTVWRYTSKTQRTTIDLVARTFPSPEATIEQFDFTIAQAVLCLDRLVVSDWFWPDLAARRLRLNACPFPVQTLVRLQRFVGRGYRACPETLRTLSVAIASLEPQEIIDTHLYRAID